MSISVRNKSNTSFYKRHSRRSSLLCHPVGLELLKHYDQLKKKGFDHELETNLVGELAKGLEPVIRGKETGISSKMVEVINNAWSQARGEHSSVAGENDEFVEGVLSQISTCGNPDAVVRLVGHCVQGENPKEAQLIIEVSVDGNGGEKKTGQAFDYACLTKDPCKTALLFTFHVDGREQPQNLKITQEAFIYVHNENEKERKMGFLWREIYEKGVKESDLDFLKKSCEGIVRCLECTLHNRDAEVITLTTQFPSKWKVASDNAVIRGDNEYVLKVFDNRHRPAFRRPDVWLKDDLPWIQNLNVETEFEFTESSDLAVLGRPETDKCKKRRRDEEYRYSSHTPYPKGSAVVIKYKYQHGTHYASKVSHFRDIAACISEMHSASIVHGDIRGFNMLHPYPEVADTKQKQSVKKSILIDYDLCGTPGKDVYPPGYSERVVDNAGERSGKATATMQFMDDWKDLRSVMVCYSVSMENWATLEEYKKASDEWTTLLDKVKDEGESSSPLPLLEEFIQNIGDATIEIFKGTKEQMEKLAIKGTGSPGKLQQEPRGSISIH